MSPAVQGFVCAFGDLDAGLAGLAWDLGDPGALLLFDGTARPATFAVEESGDAATVALNADDVSAEATFAPRDAPLPLDDRERRAGGDVTVTTGTAEVRPGGGATSQSAGLLARWQDDPVGGAGSFRFISVQAGEGTLLVTTSRGEPGTTGHGEEGTLGWRLSGEDVIRFEEALITTQYDGEGDPTRLGLELWPEDADQTSRAAATRVAGSALGGARAAGSWAGLFRCHSDGTEGLGAYLLWRA
jgi:hypothetical protein